MKNNSKRRMASCGAPFVYVNMRLFAYQIYGINRYFTRSI